MRVRSISALKTNFYNQKVNKIQYNYTSTPILSNVSFAGSFSLADVNPSILNSNFEQQKTEVITLLGEMNGIIDTSKKQIEGIEKQKNEECKKSYDESLKMIENANRLLSDGIPIDYKKVATGIVNDEIFEIQLSDSLDIKEIQILNSKKGEINKVVLNEGNPEVVYRDYKLDGIKESFSQEITYCKPYSFTSIREGVFKSVDTVKSWDDEFFSQVERIYEFAPGRSENSEVTRKLKEMHFNEIGDKHRGKDYSVEKSIQIDETGELKLVEEGNKDYYYDRVIEFENGKPISYTKGKEPSTHYDGGFKSQLLIKRIPQSKGYNAIYTKNYWYRTGRRGIPLKDSWIGSKIVYYLGEED